MFYLGGHPALATPGGVVITRVGDFLRMREAQLGGDGPTADIPVADITRVEVLQEGEQVVRKGAAVYQVERVMVLTVTTDGRTHSLRFKPTMFERGDFDSVYARLMVLSASTYDPANPALQPSTAAVLVAVAFLIVCVVIAIVFVMAL